MIMSTTDALINALDKQQGTDLDLKDIISNLKTEYQISSDRAQMLINRFGREKAVLSTAGQDLEMRKKRYGIE